MLSTRTSRFRTETEAGTRLQAQAHRHSVWIGATCVRCGKPIQATPHFTGTATEAMVTGQFAWFHVATGDEECQA